jgi:apolipoprotein N-acyltransferase
MLVAGFNACLAALLVPALRGRRPLIGAATIAAALAGANVYGGWRLAQSFDDGPALGVAVVQGGAPPLERAQRADRLARYVALTANGAAAHAGLIVWPEYAVEAYLDEPSSTRDTVLRVAETARADLILGGPHYAAAPSGTRYHNSVYLVRDGRLAGRYDKTQLVPFAEDDRLAWLRPGKTNYTPGAGDFVLSATGLNVGGLLCIESMYPGLVREAVRQGAELLVNLSNDAWFGHREPARHQLDITALRAVENRRYLVRAASTGFSAIIDPHGRTLAQSEFDTHAVLNTAVHASRARSPYQRWGDAVAWMVIAAVVGASLRPLCKRTNRHHNRRSA